MRASDYTGEEDLFVLDNQNEGLATLYLAMSLISVIKSDLMVSEAMETNNKTRTTVTGEDVVINLRETVAKMDLRGVQTDSWFADDPYSNQKLRLAVARIDYAQALASPQIRALAMELKDRIQPAQRAIRAEEKALRYQKRAPEPENDPSFLSQADDLMAKQAEKLTKGDDKKTVVKEKQNRVENFGAFESEDVVDDF